MSEHTWTTLVRPEAAAQSISPIISDDREAA
jgi:hypothetical protein